MKILLIQLASAPFVALGVILGFIYWSIDCGFDLTEDWLEDL